jgi:class 3 adenylate cyclase/tetratricopeptide (TPR) repeat protein
VAHDIGEWLEGLGLGKYAEAFVENGVDLRVLPHLNENDLKELGVLLGHRRILLAAIASVQEQERARQGQEPASEPLSRGEAERRQLTVMFCDLVGSTELSGRLDPEDLRDVMRSYQDIVTDAVTRYGGHVAKYLGDGLLVYFGWPQAYEDQAERAVRAGLDALAAVATLEMDDEAKLQARVGIATGQVVIGDLVGESGRDNEAVTGNTPNLAARLQQLAEPSQVVIEATTRGLIGTPFELEELGSHGLKGFAEPVPVWRVVAVRSVEGRFETRDQNLTPFIGREHELGLLLDRWEKAKEGEALRYQCSPYHIDNALYPVIQQLVRAARFDPADDDEAKLDKLEAFLKWSGVDVSAAAPTFALLLLLPSGARYGALKLTPEQRKARTFETLIDHIAALAERGPVLMQVEDTHWIDPTTQELLEETVSLIADRPVLMVIAHRPEWQASFQGAPHSTPLVLNRLRRSQVGELVRSAGGVKLPEAVVDEIISRTDGIPLFVEELTQSVLEAGEAATEVPETLQASLLARLDRLGPAKYVAQVGAAIGREFDRKLLVAAIGDAAEPELQASIDHLVSSGLIHKSGRSPDTSYTFKHALIQEAAYESLLKSRRRALHRDIAQALFAQAPDQATLLSYHWEQAEDLEQAFTYCVMAAEQASSLHAVREAISKYWSALNLLDRMPGSPEIEQRRISVLLSLSVIGRGGYFWRNETERSLALRHLDSAIETASDAGQLAQLACLQAYKGGSAWEDESLLARAVENAQASGDKLAQARVAERCAAYFGKHGRFERSHEHIERAIQNFGELDEKLALGGMLSGPGRCFYARAGRLDEAFRCTRLAREIADEIGDPQLKAWITMEAEPFFYKGLWEETIQVVEEKISTAWDIGAWDVILWTSAWAAIACLKLDREDDAARLIDQAMTDAIARARRDFPKNYILIALTQLQLVRGDVMAGIETSQQALALAKRGANPLDQGAVHRTLAQAHEAHGDNAAASAQFQSSLAILGKIQSPPELAQSLLAYGRFQLKTNAEEGRELMERALAIFEELSATGWIEETHTALAST